MNKEDNKGNKIIIAVVIIAIIVVLFAIFTPMGLNHIEQNNREKDVAAAQAIAQAVINDASSENPIIIVNNPTVATPDTVPGYSEAPVTEGDTVGKGRNFVYYYIKQSNTCAIYVGEDRTYNLNNERQATQYVGYKD